MANWRNIILLLLIVLISGSCDENYVSSIPSMPVSLKIDLTGKYNTFKNSSYKFIYFEKTINVEDRVGFAGVLVFSGMPNDYGNSTYYAFDMACTHEIKQDAKVFPIDNGLPQVMCNKCGTIFDVSFGLGIPDTTSGPAREILRRYKVNVTENYLYVYR